MTVKPIYLALLGVLLCFAQPHLYAQPTVRQFVGVILNAEDDVDKARRFAHLREFHAWADDISILPAAVSCPFEAGNTQQLRWNPSYNQNRYIRYDQFYGALPQKVSVVTQGAAPSMLGGGFANEVKDGKPICRSGSPSGSFNTWAYHQNPLAYKEQTIWQSLIAARYGAAPAGGFPAGFENIASTYIVAPDNTGLGLGLVREMENFNEQDASWNDAPGLINHNNINPNVPWTNDRTTYFFTPAEYAAMLSANYDGNCKADGFQIPGTNGAFWGIKNLSPETQVVMSGTADLRKRYINEIITACQTLRPGCTLPFDVLNMHHYPTTGQPVMTIGQPATTNPGTPLEYDVPRSYRFLTGGDVDQPIYALWAPSKNNVTYPGMLFIPKPYQAFIISSVLKIEVQDLDENGKRTLIPSGDIQSGSHAGQDGYFIKNLKITETPLYLKLNGKTDISDPVAQPVNNLQVSSVCCGAARLTWAITMPNPVNPPQNIPEVTPGTVISRWFQVYYRKKLGSNDTPSFDLSKLTTVEERLPGHFRESVVTGLQPGVDYYFFVIPVRDVVVGNEAFVKGLLPILPATLVANTHYVQGSIPAGCGATCLLSVGSDFTVTGPQATQTATQVAFGLGENNTTKCSNMTLTPTGDTLAIIPPGGIQMQPNGPLSETYEVAFATPKLLQAIYFVHGYGGPAKVRIEIIEDCCNQWKFVQEVDIQSYKNLYVLANGQLNFRRIERMRLIISRYPGSNPSLPRIYFCGSPATELCPGSSIGQPGYLTSPSGLTVKDIDTRSATIAWTPGKDKDLLPIARYRLRYGVTTDAQGNIVNPKEVYKNAPGGETTVEQTLGGLTPNTLYYTDVDVDPTTKGCTATPASLRTTFTTKDIVKIERGQTKTVQPVPTLLSVQPNPASQTVTVRSSEAGYLNWTLTYSNGVHIRGGQVTPDNDLTLDVSGLAPGLYIVTFLGGHKPPVAKTFVVQR